MVTDVQNNEPITIVTDGACKNNPGPGGWAAIILKNGTKEVLNGAEQNTTNNRMELSAAINGLRHIKEPSQIQVITDSEYLRKGITEWIHNWIRNGWKTAGRSEVKNADLWKELHTLSTIHNIKWSWVKGHSGDELNEEADALANKAIEALRNKDTVTN